MLTTLTPISGLGSQHPAGHSVTTVGCGPERAGRRYIVPGTAPAVSHPAGLCQRFGVWGGLLCLLVLKCLLSPEETLLTSPTF